MSVYHWHIHQLLQHDNSTLRLPVLHVCLNMPRSAVLLAPLRSLLHFGPDDSSLSFPVPYEHGSNGGRSQNTHQANKRHAVFTEVGLLLHWFVQRRAPCDVEAVARRSPAQRDGAGGTYEFEIQRGRVGGKESSFVHAGTELFRDKLNDRVLVKTRISHGELATDGGARLFWDKASCRWGKWGKWN